MQVCTASEAQYTQRGSNNELRNMRGRTGSPQRLLPHVTIVSAKGANETIQLSEPHLNTALPHVQRSRVRRSRLTAGRVASLRLYVESVLCVLFVVVFMRVVRRARPECCCVCRECCVCVVTCVVNVTNAWAGRWGTLRVRYHAGRACRACSQHVAENALMTHTAKKQHAT